jgi:hypothetical protein
MILQQLPEILRITYQIDHADLAGQFTAHWGNATFARPAPLHAVQIASTRHDDGWRDWDLNPKIDPVNGHPIDFIHIDVHEHTNFYRKGIASVTATDPYAGLLVNMHGCGLYNSRYGTLDVPGLERYTAQELPIVQAFIAEHEVKQQALKKQLSGVGQTQVETFEQQLWTNYRLLQTWDLLSLYFCLHDLANATPLTLGPISTNHAEQITSLQVIPQDRNTVTISPYPFASTPLTFTLIVRDIPNHKYVSDSDLRNTLHAATPRVMNFQVISESNSDGSRARINI